MTAEEAWKILRYKRKNRYGTMLASQALELLIALVRDQQHRIKQLEKRT